MTLGNQNCNLGVTGTSLKEGGEAGLGPQLNGRAFIEYLRGQELCLEAGRGHLPHVVDDHDISQT